jgi:O-antigen ligase
VVRAKIGVHKVFYPLLAAIGFSIFTLEWFAAFKIWIHLSLVLLFPILLFMNLEKRNRSVAAALQTGAVVVVMSFLPFSFGLIESINEVYNLEFYGGSTNAIIGIFQTPHVASSVLVMSILVLVHFLITSRSFFILGIVVIGIWMLTETYVRTGLVQLVAGLLVYVPRLFRFTSKGLRQAILVGIGLVVLGSLRFSGDDVFMRRLTGQHDFYQEDNLESLGSGRGKLWLAAADIVADNNIYDFIFGIGQEAMKAKMYDRVGYRIITHSGFLDALLVRGLVGLFLLCIFLLRVWRFGKARRNQHYREIVLSAGMAFVIYTFFQEYDMVYNLIILAVVMYHAKVEDELYSGEVSAGNSVVVGPTEI